MDSSLDFIQPEFLNILFFQQKNLVIFPYVDNKYLKTLEIFTEGYNVIGFTLDQMQNPEALLGYESYGPYAHERMFYIVIGLSRETVKKFLQMNKARVIFQSNYNIKDLANGSTEYIFYNKKTKKFLNFNFTQEDLEFETHIIRSSKNQEALQDKIHQIKIAGSRLFQELNQYQKGKGINLEKILHSVDKIYWYKAFQFVENYYDIVIPEEVKQKADHCGEVVKTEFPLIDFSDEYEQIVSINHQLGSLFIQHLHEWREKHVNASNLDLTQLFHPNQLYNYLRKRHWKDGVSSDFVEIFIDDCEKNCLVTEANISDLEKILLILGVDSKEMTKLTSDLELNSQSKYIPDTNEEILDNEDDKNFHLELLKDFDDKEIENNDSIPSIENFEMFKSWLISILEILEKKMKK